MVPATELGSRRLAAGGLHELDHCGIHGRGFGRLDDLRRLARLQGTEPLVEQLGAQLLGEVLGQAVDGLSVVVPGAYGLFLGVRLRGGLGNSSGLRDHGGLGGLNGHEVGRGLGDLGDLGGSVLDTSSLKILARRGRRGRDHGLCLLSGGDRQGRDIEDGGDQQILIGGLR